MYVDEDEVEFAELFRRSAKLYAAIASHYQSVFAIVVDVPAMQLQNPNLFRDHAGRLPSLPGINISLCG